MILNFTTFSGILNEKLFEGSSSDLVKKIADNPERYVGLFRPTKPKTKIIQNITQSHEIKFGDALETLFEVYFKESGFKLLPKKLTARSGDIYNIDQLFSVGATVYMIEQKVRDDHDSTKKRGQFTNFENKYYEVSKQYKKVIPIMWFIDDSLQKNKRYYEQEMAKMSSDYGCSPKLYYGDELFTDIRDIPVSIWNEVVSYLRRWKDTLPDMPEINLDLNCNEVFSEIKDMEPSVFRKLFNNDDVKEQVLPVIFPEGKVLKLLAANFSKKSDTVHRSIATLINQYIRENY